MGGLSFPLLCLPLMWTVLLFARLYRKTTRCAARTRGCLLPPGPPGLPLIGNLLDLPSTSPWLGYRSLSRKYGKLVYMEAMGKSLLIVDDADVAMDLCEKRSSIYSSRPTSPMYKLTGWEWIVGLVPYGELWRRLRRMLWQHFHPGVVHKYHATQQDSVRNLLSKLLQEPEKLAEHIRLTLGASIIATTYGLAVRADADDEYSRVFEEGLPSFRLLTPGSSILEFFPSLARIPTWVPGTGYLRYLARARQATYKLRDFPWAAARKASREGNICESFASAVIDHLAQLEGDTAVDEHMARDVAGVIYAAGIDTLHVTLCAFFVAMTRFPEVQKKVQAELDAVVGRDRLPQPSDREHLPYVNAAIKEGLRWHTTTPFGLPHATSADDEYNGFFIPKDTIVVVNVWSLMNNPEVYPEAERFMPERFLKDGRPDSQVRDPTSMAFGFGRRICPGRHYADMTLFMYVASVLHLFNVAPPLDADGRPIEIELRPSTGLISHLEDCRYTVVPRFSNAEALIHGSEFGI